MLKIISTHRSIKNLLHLIQSECKHRNYISWMSCCETKTLIVRTFELKKRKLKEG